ncbi:MAG TPA: xanthine dehydrogenase family protein molybdopterin-binding subunit [bacterium]|nr:xanthine dehydrogenase family protein molybdopterin-binding subunit [bacterium]
MPHRTSDATSPEGPLIGRHLKRREDLRFLQGRARYVDDIVLPNMAHLVVVPSAHAHAHLRGVRVDAARRAPGVIAVVVAGDLAGRVQPMPVSPLQRADLAKTPHPVLAEGKVRYVGEPIAAVLADSLAAAIDAATLVVVDYDPLPALSDARAAPRAPVLLHEELGDNVLIRMTRGSGDVDAAFAAAACAVSGRFHIPRVVPAPMEPRAAVAAYDPAGDLLTLWVSAQEPYRPRTQLSRMLGRPEDRIRVVVPDVGGAFGSKGALASGAVVAAHLAVETGRPIKWVEQRRDNFIASTHGRGFDADLEVAVEPDGKITALRGTVVADAGAYLYPATATPTSRVAELVTGVYDIPSARIDVIGTATNKVPTSAYRGAGRPEAAYLIECMVDLVARALSLDPAAVRRRNLISPERFPYRSALGSVYDSGNYARALDRACELVDYGGWRETQRRARAAGRLLGVGLSVYVEPAGGQLWESAAVSVHPDGQVVVRTGSTAHGQGHDTTFGQIAADTLKVPLDTIVVQQGDTALMPKGVGTFGSRSVAVGGAALVGELEKIKTKMRSIAAHLLEASDADIQWDDGRLSVRGAPARAVTFREVAAAAHQPARLPAGVEPGLEASGTFSLPDMVYPFGAYAAVVEIERETGEVRILKFVAVDDAGRIINPLLAEGQVIGAIVQGLGQALVEEVVYDDTGQLLTATFTDYAMLRAPHIPAITAEFTETLSPYTSLAAKGIGEAGTVGAPPALANAVLDALAPLGVRSVDLPLTREKLWRLVRES